MATETVISRWTEQGIWNNNWDPQDLKSARWKHEELSELNPGSDSDSPGPPPIFGEKQERSKNDGKICRSTEQLAREKNEREASRPCHQFNYQILKEREHISTKRSMEVSDSELDIEAFENVKQRWVDRGIWDASWLRLPGLSWKHEKPRKHEIPNTPQLHQTLHSSTQNRRTSNNKLPQNSKCQKKAASALERVSDASKAIKKQNC